MNLPENLEPQTEENPEGMTDEDRVRGIFDRLIAKVEETLTNSSRPEMIRTLLKRLEKQRENLDKGDLESINDPHLVYHALIRMGDTESVEDSVTFQRIFPNVRD